MFNNDFTCPEGHSFKANAKIRARCPTCGKMARRDYSPKEPEHTNEGVVTGEVAPTQLPVTTPTPTPKPEGIKLIRRGKPKKVVMMPKKTTTPAVVKKPVNKLVTRKTVSTGTKKKPAMPKVVKRPPRTAVARHVAGAKTGTMSYADMQIARAKLW